MYQVFNPIQGQYVQCTSIDIAKNVKTEIEIEYATFQGIGVQYTSNQIVPYDPNWLIEFGITEEEYLQNPFYVLIPYNECTPEQKDKLDAEKQLFINQNKNLFFVNEETTNSDGSVTWTVIEV